MNAHSISFRTLLPVYVFETSLAHLLYVPSLWITRQDIYMCWHLSE